MWQFGVVVNFSFGSWAARRGVSNAARPEEQRSGWTVPQDTVLSNTRYIVWVEDLSAGGFYDCLTSILALLTRSDLGLQV